jgi:hypothetical protein
MSRPKGVELPKRLHIELTLEEHRRIKVVAAHEGKDIARIFRETFLADMERRYEALGIDNAGRKATVRRQPAELTHTAK